MATRQATAPVDVNWGAKLPSNVVQAEVSRQLSARAETETLEDEEDDSPLARVIAQLTSSDDEKARVKVYRQDPRMKTFAYCGDYTPAQFAEGGENMIREDWGAGTFELRVYAMNANGRYVVAAKPTIIIAEKMSAIAPVIQQQNSEMTAAIQILAQGQQAILQALTTRPPERDQMEEMTKMMTFMATMKEVMGVGKNEKSSIAEIIDAIKEMKGVSELIGGGEKKEDPTSQLLSLGSEVIGMVKTGMQSTQQPAQQAAQPFPQLAVPASFNTPTEVHQSNPIPETDDADMLEKLLLLANLKKFALMAGDVSKIEAAADFLDEKLTDELLELLHQDAWFELLQAATQSVPELTPILTPILTTHREWLTKVRTALLQEPTP